MLKIFELTKREQRIVIVIVTLLVLIAFAKHFWEGRSAPAIAKPAPTSSATDASNQLGDKSGKRP